KIEEITIRNRSRGSHSNGAINDDLPSSFVDSGLAFHVATLKGPDFKGFPSHGARCPSGTGLVSGTLRQPGDTRLIRQMLLAISRIFSWLRLVSSKLDARTASLVRFLREPHFHCIPV